MNSFLNQYPEVIAIAVALLGFAGAYLIAGAFERSLDYVDRGVRRISPIRADQLARITPRTLIARIIYYATLIFFLLLAIRILGITALSDWLDVFLGYIPQILLGGIIIIVGYLLGLLVYSVIDNLLASGQSRLLPRLAQVIVVVTAVITGLDQMEIDISFITYVIVILLATSLGGLSLAFALGSRELVANLIARRVLTNYRVGDHIEIDGVDGIIIEFTTTGVSIETESGVTTIPASFFVGKEVTVRKS